MNPLSFSLLHVYHVSCLENSIEYPLSPILIRTRRIDSLSTSSNSLCPLSEFNIEFQSRLKEFRSTRRRGWSCDSRVGACYQYNQSKADFDSIDSFEQHQGNRSDNKRSTHTEWKLNIYGGASHHHHRSPNRIPIAYLPSTPPYQALLLLLVRRVPLRTLCLLL